MDEREKETLRLSSKIKSMDFLAGSIEKNEGITGLRSAIRTRKVSKARRLFCQLAVGKMGAKTKGSQTVKEMIEKLSAN